LRFIGRADLARIVAAQAASLVATRDSKVCSMARSSWFGASTVALCCFALPALAQGDVENGKNVFRLCSTCHQIGEGAKNIPMGPKLNGIVGRKAGTIEGFNYSDANKKAGEQGLTWTPETLSEFLKNPRSFMPNNKMMFAGVRDDQDRRDLVAYLSQSK
jgi:cytochrome c